MFRLIILLSLIPFGAVIANDGDSILQERCVSCHDIQGPAAQTVKELWTRKAPDLFYAGSKYKREWMERWLQKPIRIRPAGYHYFQHIKPGKKRDVIDKSTLKEHLSLTQNEAENVTTALMEKKAKPGLIKQGDFKGGSISLSFGEMVFDKFNGCMGCHEIEPKFGGASGPEVYTAAHRLQEDFMVSFIRNPQAWNPKSLMPNKHTAEPNIQKLVQYMIALSKENWDEK